MEEKQYNKSTCPTGQPAAPEGNLKTFVAVCVQIEGVSQWGCLQYLSKLVNTLQPLAQLSVACYVLPVHKLFFLPELSGFMSLNLANWICFGDAEIHHFPSLRIEWFHTDSHKKHVLIVFLTAAALGRQLRESPQSKQNYWPAD